MPLTPRPPRDPTRANATSWRPISSRTPRSSPIRPGREARGRTARWTSRSMQESRKTSRRRPTGSRAGCWRARRSRTSPSSSPRSIRWPVSSPSASSACRGPMARSGSIPAALMRVGATARPEPRSISGRPAPTAASPRQNGIPGAAPWASSTRTLPASTRRMPRPWPRDQRT